MDIDTAAISRDERYSFVEIDEMISIRDFYDTFHSHLPQTVIAVEGNYSNMELDCFCAGQVMYIHSFTKQKRIVARDGQGRTYSIPQDYWLKFKVVKTRTVDGEEQTLKEILESNELPVQVKFSVNENALSFSIGGDIQKAKDFSNMVLALTYDETYLVANCINTNDLDKRTVLVPIYIEHLYVARLIGIQGKSVKFWKGYQKHIEAQLESITIPPNLGYKDITFLSADAIAASDAVYEYIVPDSYLKLSAMDSVDDKGYAIVSANALGDHLPKLPNRKLATEKTLSIPKVIKRFIDGSPKKPKKTIKTKQSGNKGDVKSGPSETTDISGLDIHELADKMTELKLEKYVQIFQMQGIDGMIAQDLTRDDLKSDFSFTTVEAIKFCHFAKSGHIPK